MCAESGVVAAMAIMVVMTVTIAIAMAFSIFTVTTATTRTHLLSHGLCHLFISWGMPLVDRQAKVLIDGGEHLFQLFSCFQKVLTTRIVHHITPQLIELCYFFFTGRHTGCTFFLKLGPIFTDPAE